MVTWAAGYERLHGNAGQLGGGDGGLAGHGSCCLGHGSPDTHVP